MRTIKKEAVYTASFISIVTRLGFEPKTHSLEGCCSIQLSYQAIAFAGAKVRLFFKCGPLFAKKCGRRGYSSVFGT